MSTTISAAEKRQNKEALVERKRENHRKWRKANIEKVYAANKKWREANKEWVKNYSKKYRKEHPEEYKLYFRNYQRTHKEKVYQWIQKYTHAPKNRCVYSITCLVNGKIYIGSSICVTQRKANSWYRLKSGTHQSPDLQKDYNKYGKSQFVFSTIRCLGDVTIPVLRNAEQEEINLVPVSHRYNKNKVAIW